MRHYSHNLSYLPKRLGASVTRTRLIVGACLIDATASVATRTPGYGGQSVVVGHEVPVTYSRRPLSKALVRSRIEAVRTYLRAAARGKDIKLFLGRACMDPARIAKPWRHQCSPSETSPITPTRYSVTACTWSTDKAPSTKVRGRRTTRWPPTALTTRVSQRFHGCRPTFNPQVVSSGNTDSRSSRRGCSAAEYWSPPSDSITPKFCAAWPSSAAQTAGHSQHCVDLQELLVRIERKVTYEDRPD